MIKPECPTSFVVGQQVKHVLSRAWTLQGLMYSKMLSSFSSSGTRLQKEESGRCFIGNLPFTSSGGLQHLIDGVHQFCLGMGLTISPTKTEVVVFRPQPLDSRLTWHVGGELLPVSPSFKYLGQIFHQSGDMVPAFQRLLQNGNGVKATLIAKFKRLHCNKSFPMMRRLF